jgi:hypothetical protein
VARVTVQRGVGEDDWKAGWGRRIDYAGSVAVDWHAQGRMLVFTPGSKDASKALQASRPNAVNDLSTDCKTELVGIPSVKNC